MMLREQHVAIPLVANDEMIAVLVLDALRGVEPNGRARAAQPARPPGRAAPGGAALRAGPRHGHQRGAPADRPRGPRRRRPGRRLARLPRGQPRRHRHRPGPACADRPAPPGGDPGRHRAAALDLRPEARAGRRRRPRREPLGVRQPGQRDLAHGRARHPRREGPPAAGGRRVRAAPDRPGGDGQRPQALRAPRTCGCAARCARRTPRSRCATTASTATRPAATPRGCRSCGSAR